MSARCFGLFFHPGPIVEHEDVKGCDFDRFNAFFHAMLRRGIYLAPSQYEAGFLSLCHTDGLIDRTLQAAEDSLAEAF